MSPTNFVKTLIVIVVLGYLYLPDNVEARGLTQQEAQELLSQADAYHQLIQQQSANNPNPGQQEETNLDKLIDAADEDEGDEDISKNLIPANYPTQASSSLQETASSQYAGNQFIGANGGIIQQKQLPASDLKSEASKHYHHKGHGAKGWLDMGAWTGKKGAFGWYDKHPVGKGK